jgi:aldose 1-epimerase
MQTETTLPGLQLYTANSMPADRKGKGGCFYGPYAGFCLETQFFPNTPNQPAFPSATLKAGEAYQHCTVFRFTR